jgi:hypothetical protein
MVAALPVMRMELMKKLVGSLVFAGIGQVATTSQNLCKETVYTESAQFRVLPQFQNSV